ncbi:MAG: ribose 5-phosphate isomerase B [Pedobacter sp.]|nr:MAG: ribose 5-phosphate isomerase B [Pedobacter sp.]
MENSIKIAIGADHAGFEYKNLIKNHLSQYLISDFGTKSADSVDYPDYAHPVAEAVESGDCKLGILICGSANGVAITANKHAGIRAAICWKTEIASLARQHNDANIVCIPARFVSPEEALEIIDTFLKVDFEGGRHQNRVNKITCQ